MEKNLMQILSENFIAAQSSMDGTVGDLRVRLRGLVARLEVTLDSLESDGVGSDVSAISGLSEDASRIEKLSSKLIDQQEYIKEACHSALKASNPKGF
jgi:hypothetical protein